MSIITQAIVAERYGVRLGIEDLAKLLQIAKGSVYNQLSAGTFPIKTYVDQGKRWADFRDVAEHLDQCRARAQSGEDLQA